MPIFNYNKGWDITLIGILPLATESSLSVNHQVLYQVKYKILNQRTTPGVPILWFRLGAHVIVIGN